MVAEAAAAGTEGQHKLTSHFGYQQMPLLLTVLYNKKPRVLNDNFCMHQDSKCGELMFRRHGSKTPRPETRVQECSNVMAGCHSMQNL